LGLLEGLRVVEVALLAPNMVGMHLADLGADVIKVEEPGGGDYTRRVGSARVEGLSLLHLRWNRGKRSVTLDLRAPDGAEVFRDLVDVSDVVLEGLRPGALARRGLGYEGLRGRNPALVFCSLSGFGQTGPYRDLATHGVAYDAYAGLAAPGRSPEGLPSLPARYLPIGTQAGALYAALGVVAAVLRARETGQGSFVDVAQADAAVAWNAGSLDPVLIGLERPSGRALTEAVRYQYYETSDARLVLFQASERAFFENFCRAVEREDLLAGDRGADVGEHAEGDAKLRQELAALFATRTQAEWVALFIEHNVPGGPVHVGAEVVDDPQFRARTQLVEHDHPHAGPLRMVGPPVRTPEGRATMRPAPAPGQDTDDVLTAVLGYDSERIAALRSTGALGP
jgi:crotonobetainyl-CoA:carnitine CoA-transferase CaiB-like acyl-CoA transferase